MGRSSPNLTLSFPNCRHCGRHWRPAADIVADSSYCKMCAQDRQSMAIDRFELKSIKPSDLTGKFLLPRRFRLN